MTKPKWSLTVLLESLHKEIHQKLETARKTFNHPTSKGDASCNVWLELFKTYLPNRYQTAKAFVVDSNGEFSEQMDVVIFDRQYSPFIFNFQGELIVPAESVYAVFEAKQTVNADLIKYAQKKIESVRKLSKTSLPIPYVAGTYPPKKMISIFGGVLSFESEWKPALGKPLLKSLQNGIANKQLDFGCVAAHGYFYFDKLQKKYRVETGSKTITGFLFRLISDLQLSGTVPMLDVQAYAKWLTK